MNECYKCVYRGNVPGDAHSCCRHPDVKDQVSDPFSSIMAIFASVGRTEPVQAKSTFIIRGDPHGIKNGWFNWPWNFDPVWVQECGGLKEKEDEMV